MKKAVYRKIDEKIIEQTIHHEESIDENGNVIEAYDEVIDKVVPVMGVVYEEMTQDEILSLDMETSDNTPYQPTYEERLAAIEGALLDIILGGAL